MTVCGETETVGALNVDVELGVAVCDVPYSLVGDCDPAPREGPAFVCGVVTEGLPPVADGVVVGELIGDDWGVVEVEEEQGLAPLSTNPPNSVVQYQP